MSNESGGGARDSLDQNSGTEPAAAGNSAAPRKVAKTMIEGQIPTLPEALESKPNEQEPTADKPRKVAKTLLETSMPSREEIEAASQNSSENKRVVPKTMLEISKPDLSALTDSGNTVEAEKKRSVPKTMMEMSIPSQSETGKQVRKIKKTRLDSRSLNAIGINKTSSETNEVPVKVRKTLTSEIMLAAAQQDSNEQLTKDSELHSASAEPQKKERFVAKTMLDHSVLSEQLVKSHEKEKMRAAYIAQEKANEPVKEFHEVDSKKMASPCAWTWAESGVNKGRVRACDKCQTNVYDFTGLEMPDAEALIFKHESRKKFTLFKRQDGKFMTRDCPVQAARKKNLFMLVIAAILVVVAAVAAMLLAPPPAKSPESTAVTSGKGTTGGEAGSDTSASSGTATGTGTGSGSGSGSSATSSAGESSTMVPGKDGVMTFEAGEPVKNQPKPTTTNNSFFPSVGGDLPSHPTAPATTGGTGGTAPATKPAGSGDENKYWE